MHAALSVLALLASTVAAQTTTLDIFVGGNADQKFVGSVVDVSGSETTLAIACTAGLAIVGDVTSSCNGDVTATATYFGSTGWRESSSSATNSETLVISEYCSFQGTTLGVCTASVSAKVDGASSSSAVTSTITGIALRFASVPITAGVTKLASATASGTSSGNAAAPTMGTELYKVIIVPAAAMLAGAALF